MYSIESNNELNQRMHFQTNPKYIQQIIPLKETIIGYNSSKSTSKIV